MHTQRKKHYWRLDTKCLTLYKSETSSQYYKEIALADILAVDPMVNPEVYPLNPPHVFEIVTSSMTFYVGVDMTGALPRDLLQKVEGTSTCDLDAFIGHCHSNQSFYRQIASYQRGVGDHRVGQ